ncbi:Dihydropteroate synthase [Athelia psychrophila]|uniref:Dihydropteroate synthase n=1 Tax=Athelia psychrophila TaxID=1759441 RepID=A0A166JPK1_9AGAM|nr:Dihydropteroate synthase [Fibularhizoctonia sp. CBS 109695]
MAAQATKSIACFLPDYPPLPHTAAIALGSNLGDRFANIEHALRLLENPLHLLGSSSILGRDPQIVIVDTSFLYETAPMYVTDQPSFINCACMIQTTVEVGTLLVLLKKIEVIVGRVPSIRNGPRAVDLDILLFDQEVIDTRPTDSKKDLDDLVGELIVPHPRMQEREFVLRPLNDMIPDAIHPQIKEPIKALLQRLTEARPKDEPPMRKVIPFPRYPHAPASTEAIPGFAQPVPLTATHWTFPSSSSDRQTAPRKTYIMATLNATPDSFSDGSEHNTIPTAVSYANSSVALGADIIDVGGYSTRPGAAFVSEEEEINRVVPVIQVIRGANSSAEVNPKTKEALISVDTFRWKVAEEAVLAGANCINDVYSFTGPEYPPAQASADHLITMRRVARDLAVPVVLMHSRGHAGSNKDYDSYANAVDSPVLEGIRVELGDKVNAIVKGRNGLRRWFVLVDPGVGFSKSLEDNLELLRHASLITEPTHAHNPLAGYPQLIGTSRKSFLGVVLASPSVDGTYEGRQTEGRDRVWATAAAISCAVQQKATVIRVHDVQEMGDVVRVASALWG